METAYKILTFIGYLLFVVLAVDLIDWAADGTFGSSSGRLIEQIIDKFLNLPLKVLEGAINLVLSLVEGVFKAILGLLNADKVADSITFAKINLG